MTKRKLPIECPKCPARFLTERGAAQHARVKHKHVPLTQPKRTVEQINGEIAYHSLRNGVGSVALGDQLTFTQTATVIETTKTEGSDTLLVKVQLIKKSYIKN